MKEKNILQRFIFEEDGQVSVEVMILIAAVIAISIILITQMQKTAKTTAGKIDDFSTKALDNLDKSVDENLN